MHHSVDPGFFNALSIDDYLTSTERKRYFHYTDAQSALNMLKLMKDDGRPISFLDKWSDAHLEIWVTHFSYLNDWEELNHGVDIFLDVLQDSDICKSIKQSIKKKLRSPSVASKVREMPYYPLSFCENGNLLSLWKYYGKECGVAIEYNLNFCQFKGHELHSTPNQKPFHYDVEYGKGASTAKQDIFKKIFDDTCVFANTDEHDIIDRVVQSVYLLSLFMKHPSFWEEAECRLLFTISRPSEPQNIKKPVLYFRKRGDMIVPYVKVQIRSYKSNELPIKSITIGPGEKQNLVFEAFYQYILAYFPNNEDTDDNIKKSDDGCEYINTRGIELRRSTTPFRG